MNTSAMMRPSVAGPLGRPGGKAGGSASVASAAVKEVYSFPLLPLGEIVEVLREMGVVVSEDDLQKPKPDTFRHWCELFVLEILSINKEDIYTPSRQCSHYLGADEELHDESVPVVHFLRKTNKVLLTARCDEGLSLRDIMKPEKQRVQRVLSALINLYKFRSEKVAWYEENLQKKDASIARKQELLAQIEQLQQAIAAETRGREAEQPEIEAVLSQSRALEAQRDELQARVDGVRRTTEGQKEEIKGLKEQAASLARVAEELRAAIEAKRAQIVSSPAKVKAEVAGLHTLVETEQGHLDALEAEKRVVGWQLGVVAKASKDVAKAVLLMGEAETEAVKLKRVLRDEKARKSEVEALQGEVDGLRVQLEHAELGKRRAEEKLHRVKEDGQAHLTAQARALEAIRTETAEYSEQAKSAGDARRAADNEKMRLERRRQQMVDKHGAEVAEIVSCVKHLAQSVQGYHTNLFANLGAVNTMAPLAVGGQAAEGL